MLIPPFPRTTYRSFVSRFLSAVRSSTILQPEVYVQLGKEVKDLQNLIDLEPKWRGEIHNVLQKIAFALESSENIGKYADYVREWSGGGESADGVKEQDWEVDDEDDGMGASPGGPN